MSKVHILPNLRRGLSNYIEEGFKDKNGLRTGFDVKARLQGHKAGSAGSDLSELERDGTLDRTFYLAGPVDVKDISPDAIRQVVPADKSQGFSNEYLPFIEFFEEDFPWRYTPKRSTDKLCSWLLLLACTDDEFTLTTDAQGNKRVELHLEGLSEWYLNDFYPDPNWYHRDAHVQITTPGDEDPVEYVKDHPDDGFSRLFCGRLLKENTKYTVFLVPAFELGRLAGLGEPVSGSVGLTTLSFEGKPASIVYPVYYHWSFTTGKASFMTYAQKQDFISETEFRALSPGLKADISDTGLRQYRTLEPLVNDAEPVDIPVALVKKGFAEKDLSSEDPRMDGELKDLLKKSPVFSDDASGTPVYEDPWVVPPVYGARHVLAKPDELDTSQEHPFLKELNLKFRNRAVAGLGAKVVKKNQEMFMNRAWGMVEDVNRLNQRIREFYEAYKANGAADGKISSLREYKFVPHASGLQADAAIRIAQQQSAAKINPLDMATDVTGKNLHVMMSSMGDYERASGISLDQLNALARPEFWDMETIMKRTDLFHRLTTSEGFFSRVDWKYAFLKEILDVTPPTVEFQRNQGRVESAIYPSDGNYMFHFNLKKSSFWSVSNSFVFGRSQEVLRWLDDSDKFAYDKGGKILLQSLVRLLEDAKKNYTGILGEEYASFDGTFDQIMLPVQSCMKRVDSYGTHQDLLFFMRKGAYERRFKDDDKGICIQVKENGSRVYILPEKSLYDVSLAGHLFKVYCYQSPVKSVLRGVPVQFIGYRGINRFFPEEGVLFDSPEWYDGSVRIKNSSPILTNGPRASFLFHAATTFPTAGTVTLVKLKIRNVITQYMISISGKNGKGQFTLTYYPNNGRVLSLSGRSNDGKLSGRIDFAWEDGLLRIEGSEVKVDCAKISQYLTRASSGLNWFSRIAWAPNYIFCYDGSGAKTEFKGFNLLDYVKGKMKYPECLNSCRVLVADEISNFTYVSEIEETLNGVVKSITDQIVTLAGHEELKRIQEKMARAKTERNKVESADETRKESLVDADEVNRKRLVELAGEFAARGMTLDLKESNFDGKHPIMAAPVFPDPTSFYLRELSERFLLPSVDELKNNSISCFQTNPAFEEAFLAGMNTEMGRELLWREYPTDERGSYFRKFWDQDVLPRDFGKGYFDVQYMHNWKGRLGENHEAGKGRMLVFVIKSELMVNYPDTSVRLAQAIPKDGNTILGSVLSPVMTGWLADDTFMAGFQLDKLPTTQGICLSFWETDKSMRFFRVLSMNNTASDSLSSEFAVNRVDCGSVWGVEIPPEYLTL